MERLGSPIGIIGHTLCIRIFEKIAVALGEIGSCRIDQTRRQERYVIRNNKSLPISDKSFIREVVFFTTYRYQNFYLS